MQKLTQCLNCQQELADKENFCPNCGQKNHATKDTLRYFATEFFNSVFNVDERLWVTFKTAFFNVGHLAKEFNRGKRKKYVAPIQFYLFCSVFYFLLLSLNNQQTNTVTDSTIKEMIATQDTLTMSIGFRRIELSKSEFLAIPDYSDTQMDSILQIKQAPTTFFNRIMLKQGVTMITEGVNPFIEQLISLFSTSMFLLMPLFGWLLYLFFSSIYPFYMEHLIFSIYLHAIVFLFLSIDSIVDLVIGISISELIFIGVLSYFAIALKQFYGFSWLKTVGYFFLLVLIYMIILAIFMSGVTIIGLLIA